MTNFTPLTRANYLVIHANSRIIAFNKTKYGFIGFNNNISLCAPTLETIAIEFELKTGYYPDLITYNPIWFKK